MEVPDAEAWIEPDWEAHHSRAPPPVQGEPPPASFLSCGAVQRNVSFPSILPSLPRSRISSRGLQLIGGF